MRTGQIGRIDLRAHREELRESLVDRRNIRLNRRRRNVSSTGSRPYRTTQGRCPTAEQSADTKMPSPDRSSLAMVYPLTLIWCQAPSAGTVIPGKGVMLGKLVLPPSVVCRLILITWLEPSAGVSITHALMLYCEPVIHLVAHIDLRPVEVRRAPCCQQAVRPAVCGSSRVGQRGTARTRTPSIQSAILKGRVIPVLSCWLGFGGAGESSPITTSLM